MKKIVVNVKDEYPIYIGNTTDILNEMFKNERNQKVLIISDDMILDSYKESLLDFFHDATIYNINPGEDSKNIDEFTSIIKVLVKLEFSRDDYIIALGGGVVGDLAGFVASTYKRGINFINIPTSLLAMVDSSIGGKTAINFEGVKNVIGSFYSPKAVIIDKDYLKSLEKREYLNGIYEAYKMGLTLDSNIIDAILNDDVDNIILLSLQAKKKIVEEDTFDKSVRKVLNFGHTIGHAIEMNTNLLHGESIAIGMIYFIENDSIRNNTISFLNKYLDVSNIMNSIRYLDLEKLIANDKKKSKELIECVVLEDLEKYKIVKYSIDDIMKIRGRLYE